VGSVIGSWGRESADREYAEEILLSVLTFCSKLLHFYDKDAVPCVCDVSG
jgi:hypothetical protein